MGYYSVSPTFREKMIVVLADALTEEKVASLLKRKIVPWTKRVCVKHASVEPLRILCVGDDCACFVRVPIRVGKEGGAESHQWVGCMYVLDELRKCAETMSMSMDILLSLNR